MSKRPAGTDLRREGSEGNQGAQPIGVQNDVDTGQKKSETLAKEEVGQAGCCRRERERSNGEETTVG